MAKYHISLNGEATKCNARTRPCPRTEHFGDLEKAQHVAELAHEGFEKALEYPRRSPIFTHKQAQAFWKVDGGFGSGNNPFVNSGMDAKEAAEFRFANYHAGFEAALDGKRGVKAFSDYLQWRERSGEELKGRYPGQPIVEAVDETAFKLGFARGQRVADADRDEFITENIVDRGLRGGEARRKYSTARFLQQPFKRGDTIVVPAGTKFHSWDADSNDVYDEIKEAREIQISDTFNPYIDGTGDWVQLHPAQVSYAGPHGYWRDIVLTPEIVAMNGKAVYEEGMPYEDLIRTPLYEDAKV